MSTENREKRLEAIRNGLRRGDKKHIARLAGVHPVWVSYVIMGRGVSDRRTEPAKLMFKQLQA